MNSRIKVDRISVLPANVKDSILTCLTIKEAVCTSILSQSWRYQWHSLSKININRNDLLGVSEMKLVKIIDRILLFHCGSFDKFKLDIYFDMPTDVDGWILYLSRHGIKDLIISRSVGHYDLPVHLFSCSELTCLELTRCRFKPSPAAVKGFINLIVLFFDHVTIDNEHLEKLINSCPLLSRLSLLSVCTGSSLIIHAPKLVMLHISNSNAFPILKNTPLLESALFGLQGGFVPTDQDCKFALLRSMPLLRSLELNHLALWHFGVGDISAIRPFVCPVKHLTLWINFNGPKETIAVFCILRSSPFIRVMGLTFVWEERSKSIVFGSLKRTFITDEFWKKEDHFRFSFDNLQEVKLTGLSGTKYELKFIEFVLAKAPALETMEIKFSDQCKNAEDLFNIITKLTWFPRASPKAKLIVASNMSLILPSN